MVQMRASSARAVWYRVSPDPLECNQGDAARLKSMHSESCGILVMLSHLAEVDCWLHQSANVTGADALRQRLLCRYLSA